MSNRPVAVKRLYARDKVPHDAGFAMHLSKPMAIKELIVTIAAFVRHRIRG
ncbi:hypothetical protein [Nevskia ramosa]|uniref:hypothetical protein n=1 Tax=Nevskia ramosa TaxID=64002 RepID=UPI00041153AA|nr:hypothetical protein [Nevskia ramosa]